MAKAKSVNKGFNYWIDNFSNRVFNFADKHMVGIMGTISIHLVLAIVLLLFKMNYTPTPRSVEIDINFRDELLPITEEQRVQMDKIDIAIEQLINHGLEADAVKNVIGDENAPDKPTNELNPTLQDDKGTNASDIYSQRDILKQRMLADKEKNEKNNTLEGQEEIPNTPEKNTVTKENTKIKGPKVISFSLEGRDYIKLPVPSYKCQYGGQVVVDIEVDANGKVTNAKIDSRNSVNDECITEAAIAAAYNSEFSDSPNGQAKQKGSITYLFVPQ